jgi:hypothetical protein
MSVPFTRTLPYVLREQLEEPIPVSLALGTVVSVPDNAHVVVDIRGVNVTVPRLASYTGPQAGDAAYILVSPLVQIALGAIKT